MKVKIDNIFKTIHKEKMDKFEIGTTLPIINSTRASQKLMKLDKKLMSSKRKSL